MMDYRPQWYEEGMPEPAHAASEEDDREPLTPAEVYALAAIWSLSLASVLSLAYLVWGAL